VAYEKCKILKNDSDYQGAWPPLSYTNNLREKFSPGPGFKPGSPALCTSVLLNY
jgi:hypothetical protein